MITSAYNYNLGLKFYEIASIYGDKIALRFINDTEFTYSDINRLSNKMAYYLLNQGVKKGDVLAILNGKTVKSYALMLACIKVGIVYTNLDPGSPWLRLKKILDTCQPKIIFFDSLNEVVHANLADDFPSVIVEYLQSEKLSEILKNLSVSDLIQTSEINGNAPVYIMFTSGSTGFPKGAVMSHLNVLNFIQWGRSTFDITDQDVFTNANPIYFDNSVFDFFVSLFNGASLVPIPHDLLKDSKQIVNAINKSKCTIWFSVPSLLVYLLTTKALSSSDFNSIRLISFGGEGFPKNKLKQLYDLFGSRISLFNVYGPTECTCICSSYLISDVDFEDMKELAPLGKLAPNFGYELLPVEGSNTPDLKELALTGPCVGLGYFNDPERTKNAFVQTQTNPFNSTMYRTGDIVELRDNGYFYFKGRIDNQIKHMGYRIELEEVEAAFSSLKYINEVGVIYERINPDFGQIKAFVSLDDDRINMKLILEDIRKILPTYMVPRLINILPNLPKNANGKIDRKQLV